jgi:hypothetical protein
LQVNGRAIFIDTMRVRSIARRMQRTTRTVFLGLLLFAATPLCHALIMFQGLDKARAEKELGIVIKREYLGIGSATNEAGIAMEFPRRGKLENYISVHLNVYSEWPKDQPSGPLKNRRLISATLRPVSETSEKVQVYFTVDADCVGRTEISITVKGATPENFDGYSIRLNAKDFPPPQPPPPHQARTTNPIKMAQAKFTGGIGAVMTMDSTNKLPVIRDMMPNSPAAKADLRRNDIVLKINGTSTSGRSLKEVVADLRGVVGTTVTLTVQRGGTNLDCIVHRTSWENLHVEPPPLFDSDKLNPSIRKY